MIFALALIIWLEEYELEAFSLRDRGFLQPKWARKMDGKGFELFWLCCKRDGCAAFQNHGNVMVKINGKRVG